MKGRAVLLFLALCLTPLCCMADDDPDTVDVYIVPMDDIPEDLSSAIAKTMSDDMKLQAKGSMRMGSLDVLKLPGSNQLIAEDILAKAQPVLRSLPSAGPKTYFLILTARDINSASGNFRFQFSMHSKELHTSVVSMARLFNYRDGKAYADQVAYTRLYKMTKRAIGEMHLGWQRSTNRRDIMYSPLMGVPDLDSIGLEHEEKAAPVRVPVVPAPRAI